MKNTKILSVLELVKEPAFRWQLYMIVILTATIQLCGINAVECTSPLKSQDIMAHQNGASSIFLSLPRPNLAVCQPFYRAAAATKLVWVLCVTSLCPALGPCWSYLPL